MAKGTPSPSPTLSFQAQPQTPMAHGSFLANSLGFSPPGEDLNAVGQAGMSGNGVKQLVLTGKSMQYPETAAFIASKIVNF